MFRFMNELWRENQINYNGQQCETLVYNVVPMAIDFGAIEFIEGATKISHIDDVISNVDLSEDIGPIMDRLIATAAASYVIHQYFIWISCVLFVVCILNRLCGELCLWC